MKPRYRPGKPASNERSGRLAKARAKTLSSDQLNHLNRERTYRGTVPKAGKGGERKQWEMNYEEACEYRSKSMPCSENESISHEGTRRFPRNRR